MRSGKSKIFFGLFFLAAIALLPFVVMALWNALIPEILGFKTITYLQALGLFVLSRILFGGFRMGGGHRRPPFADPGFRNKWMNMTPEEREEFKARWKDKCR